MGTYEIWQIRDGEEGHAYRWMGTDALQKRGLEIRPDLYAKVYADRVTDTMLAGGTDALLEYLFMIFNTKHPRGFMGHSLSVSDVVVLQGNGPDGGRRAYYVDPIGFTEVPGFCAG